MTEEQWELGLAAADRRDWPKALELLSDALEAVLGAGPEHLDALAQAAWWSNDVDTAIAARERAFKLYRGRGDQHSAALVAIALAADYARRMQSAIASAWLTRARGLAASQPESEAAGQLARTEAHAALDSENFELALDHCDDALRIARAVGSLDLEMLATHDRGQVLISMGRVEEGRPLMEEAMLSAASGELSPMVVGPIYCNMISTCLDTMDYGAAAQWGDAAERWCEGSSSESSYPGICRIRRSEINRHRGLLDAAEIGARDAITDMGSFPGFAAAAHAELGSVHLRRGELDLSDSEFSKAHSLGNSGMPGLALLRRAQGKPAVATALVRSELDAVPSASLKRARLLPTAIELLIEGGDVEGARQLTDELVELSARYGTQAMRAAGLYARGLLATESGDTDQATRCYRDAFHTWAACGIPYDAARARLALGRSLALAGKHDAATLEVQAAASEFDRLDAALDLKDARHFLADDEVPVVDPSAEALTVLTDLNVAQMSQYFVAGAYARFDEGMRNRLADSRQRIRAGLLQTTGNRENHLVWAAPGSGKTFFVQQIAKELEGIRYVEINLAGLNEDEFRGLLSDANDTDGPCLILIDEVDAKPDASWPYEALLPFLDANVSRDGQLVVVMAGSSGASIEDLKRAINGRPKGADLLSRTPSENELVVSSLDVGDQFLVALSQAQQAANRLGTSVHAAEKAALYYLAVTPYLKNARQLTEFMARAVGRMPAGEDRLKYDHLFSPGDPENKQFWITLTSKAQPIMGAFVTIA